MFSRKTLSPGLVALAAGLWGLTGPRTAAAEAPAPAHVHIGMVQTLFSDIPQTLVDVMAQPFSALMKDQTRGKLIIGGDAFHVGKLLHDDKYQIGIFQGIEFAWAQHKYPDLRPLMIAVSKYRLLHGNLVVSSENAATSPAALKGKDLALPRRSKAHIHLFLEKICGECGQTDPKAFFGRITRPNSVEGALDAVVFGKVQAAVVDDLLLEHYKELKPGCFASLKVLERSAGFPTGVIAYREGGLDKDTLDRFRDGMVNANKNTRARELMALFQFSSFDPIPADHAKTLASILRAYPSPDFRKASVKTGSQ